jgi:hypothetical protein
MKIQHKTYKISHFEFFKARAEARAEKISKIKKVKLPPALQS